MSDGSNISGLIRSYVERVLRLKAEQDQLSEDIREIYKEAKGNGFDKTVLGQIVAHIRRVEKDPDKVAENQTLFDRYLAEYENGEPLTRVRSMDYAKAREAAGLNGRGDH